MAPSFAGIQKIPFFFLLAAFVFAVVLVFPAAAVNTTQPTTAPTTIPTTTPTTVPTTVATTVPTTTPTTVPTTTATTATTTVATTVATTVPTTTATTVPTTAPTTVATTATPATTQTTAPPVPVAGFSASPTSGAPPLTVQFTDASDDATSWTWNFGDGTGSSTLENPSYTYAAAGTYTVSLTATNSAGSNTDTLTNYITVTGSGSSTAPVASFQESTLSGPAPLTVQFTDSSTNTPTSWEWEFGDGGTNDSSADPVYTYDTAGTYTVTMMASNAGGSNTTVQDNLITVTAGSSGAPVASFQESMLSGPAPLTVQFTDTSTNTPTSWLWDFGDGSTSTVENPSHTYENTGNFAVSLQATNGAGENQSTQSDTIAVSGATATAVQEPVYVAPVATSTTAPPIPEISFEGTPTSGPAPLAVRFTATTPGSPESWYWDFGDGGTSTEQEPTYTYSLPGTYTVTLTVKYAGGSRPSVKESYITVSGKAAGSPVPPELSVLAVVIAGMVAVACAARRR